MSGRLDRHGSVADARATIGMALYGDLTFDSRVRREATTLAESGYDVRIVCLGADVDRLREDLPDRVTVIVSRPDGSTVLPGSKNPFSTSHDGRLTGLLRRVGWLAAYVRNLVAWGRSVPTACGPVDAWHLHDFVALAAVAPRVKDVPVVYDAHDLFLETGTALRLPGPLRLAIRAYERRLVARVAAVITVNDAVAALLRKRYRPARIEVLHNCAELTAVPSPRPSLIRDTAGIPFDAPVVLYHGSMALNRGVEQLMAALLEPGLERAHLVLMGFGERRPILAEAARMDRYGQRVHLLEPVPPSALLAWVASADIGAMPIQPTTRNHVLSTPNKLFESLMAGIPVVTSDFPAMRQIVLDPQLGPLGAVCDPASPVAVAGAIRSLLELDPMETRALRDRCLEAARTKWNWQRQAVRLTALYEDLVPSGHPPTSNHEPSVPPRSAPAARDRSR
jgi:glycosyltransferase involved in cell wall biosynthesis